jgi:hypothetical protein
MPEAGGEESERQVQAHAGCKAVAARSNINISSNGFGEKLLLQNAEARSTSM